MNLRYSVYDNDIGKHPQEDMRDLGISYVTAFPAAIADCWVFWGCDTDGKGLPKYIKAFRGAPELYFDEEMTAKINAACAAKSGDEV